MKQNLVTRRQALLLKRLGFKDPCSAYMSRTSKEDVFGFLVTEAPCINHNTRWFLLSIPTVDEVIDWLRRKHNIIVYNAAEPYVDPIHPHINFAFKVKTCDMQWGWNARKYLDRTKSSKNIYACKREAITIALKYLCGSVATSQRKV